MITKIDMCACGGKCDGQCKEENLHRQRQTLTKCPAHYEKEIREPKTNEK